MIKTFIFRKVMAASLSTFIFSCFISLAAAISEKEANVVSLIGSIFMFCLFIGVIIFTYGNSVSIILSVFFRNLKEHGKLTISIYILLHGLFGAFFSVLYQSNLDAALLSAIPAILYGIIDIWLLKKNNLEN